MIKDVLLALYLVVLSVFDRKEKAVPIMLLGMGIVGALFWMIYRGMQGNLYQSVLGLLPGLLLLVIAGATKKAGYADGIVLGIVGAVEGYKGGILIWGISMCAMSVCAIVLLCSKRASRETKLPYIPFLCGGYFLWMVFMR